MVKLTPLKIRRMSLGLRQIDVVIGTGISPSRYSAIESELTRADPAESKRIEAVLEGTQSAAEKARQGFAFAEATERNLVAADPASHQEPHLRGRENIR